MQTCRQSRLEVGADFGVSLVVNLVAQLCFCSFVSKRSMGLQQRRAEIDHIYAEVHLLVAVSLEIHKHVNASRPEETMID